MKALKTFAVCVLTVIIFIAAMYFAGWGMTGKANPREWIASETTAPYIGKNGNWFIGETDTGIKAAGPDGTNGADGINGENGTDGVDGETPYIGENGNWFIGEIDTGIKAAGTDGANGETPHIGENGNWFIGETDTGVKAAGTDGTNGETPYIGENGNWFIGETDTGVKAAGTDGKDGIAVTDGLVFVADYLGGHMGYMSTSFDPSNTDKVTKMSDNLYRHHLTCGFANSDIYNSRAEAYTSWEEIYTEYGEAYFTASGSAVREQDGNYGLWVAQGIKANYVTAANSKTGEPYYRCYIRCRFYKLISAATPNVAA